MAPGDLAHLDGHAVEALTLAYAERWTMLEELLATQADLLYNLIAVTVAGTPGGKQLKPWRVPRPSDRAAEADRKVSPARLAAILSTGRAAA